MVCAPVRSIIPSLKLGDYLSVQAHNPCSISHLYLSYSAHWLNAETHLLDADGMPHSVGTSQIAPIALRQIFETVVTFHFKGGKVYSLNMGCHTCMVKHTMHVQSLYCSIYLIWLDMCIYQHVCGKADDSQISESKICIINFFFQRQLLHR